MRLVINPDQSMACAERLPIGIVDIARAGSLASDIDLGAIMAEAASSAVHICITAV